MAGGRLAVAALGHVARFGDLLADLGAGQKPAMARLGALAEFDLDHLDLIVRRPVPEPRRIEPAIAVAAAEIARSDLPDDVAAMFEMIRRKPAFAGVVVEAADLRAPVQRLDRIGGKRAE